MSRATWPDFGPDVEYIRQQMSLDPPDPGSVVVENDGDRVTGVSWTHGGERRSVSTPIVSKLDDAGN